MIYSLSLESALLLTGVILVLMGGAALMWSQDAQAGLRDFPRSQFWGTVLMAVATVWSFWLVNTIDLGEFDNWRGRLKIIVPLLGIAGWKFVEDFLPVRALGMCLLLAAEPLLEAAWMRPEMSKLVLVTLVFIWIVASLFWIGVPYVLRDQISWVTKTAARWRNACVAVIGYGAVLLILGLTLRR